MSDHSDDMEHYSLMAMDQPSHVGASLTELFSNLKKWEQGGNLMVITVEQSNETGKEVRGRMNWGVKAGGKWYKLFCDFRPQPGQSFDVMVKPSEFQGKTYLWAEIIAPAPQQQAPSPQPSPMAQPAPSPLANSQSGGPGGGSGKIPWGDWVDVALAAWRVSQTVDPPMPFAEGVNFVNTSLIAFSNGRLESPPREPGQDDDIPEFLR